MMRIIFLYTIFCINLSAPLNKVILEQLLPPTAIILEAGAYDGCDTQEIAQLFPHSSIYAFEPVPHLFKLLQTYTYASPNVHCIKKALSTTTGSAKFFVSNVPGALSGSSSLLEPEEHLTYHPLVTFDTCIQVETINLDEWAYQNTIDHIDFMWLDMQGAELDVLKAAPNIVKKTKMIYLEVAYIHLYKNSHLFDEVRSWFESQGFILIFSEATSAAEGNALFMRKEK